MQNEVSSALEFALEYIDLNDFITDRPSLLNGRLVCRAWRTSRTFSAKISTATLHTLADVQLAAAYLPTVPCQRLPWRSVEESCAFPNLQTIFVPEYLSKALGGCSLSMESLKSIRGIDCHVLNVSADSWASEIMLTVSELASIGCSIQLIWGKDSYSLREEQGANSAVLAHITRLELTKAYSFEVQYLNLEQLPSLRHLVLPRRLLCGDRERLEGCLSVCASLTQLSRLEFSGNAGALSEELRAMYVMADFLAPDVVRELELKVDEEGYDQVSIRGLHASFSQGIFKLDKLDYFFIVDDIPDELPEIIKYSSSAHQLKIGTNLWLGDSFHIKPSTYVSSQTETGAFCIDFMTSEAMSHAEEINGPRHADSRPFWTPPPMHAVHVHLPELAIASEQNLQRTFRGFDAKCECGVNKLNDMTEQLPAMLPHLQDLELQLNAAVPQFMSALHRLTTLTRLTFDTSAKSSSSSSSSAATLPGSVPSIPASLKELSMSAQYLEILPASVLPHLTKLTVTSMCDETAAVNAFLSCNAPLKDLSFDKFPLQDSLPSLACAFPRIETLELQLKGYDVSPLSNLQVLGRLTVTLPFPAEMSLMGADTLVALASLEVRNANDNLEGLINLGSLTHLQTLCYWIRTLRTGTVSKWKTETRIKERWHAIQEDLCMKMPHTRVKVKVTSILE